MRAIRGAAGCLLLGTVLLTGCAGPSTRILPREIQMEAQLPDDMPVLEEANPFYIRETLALLAGKAPEGPEALEQGAVDYMVRLLGDYGYTVEQEPGEGPAACVSAVRLAENKDADIVIITAGHDYSDGSPASNRRGSGIAVWLETARLLADLPSDTELRFVSFDGPAGGTDSAQRYIDGLSRRERERIIGVIALDAMGYIRGGGLTLGTVDGRATLLGDLLAEAAEAAGKPAWEYERREGGIHSRFVRAQIPAVRVGQRREAYECGSMLDVPAIVDADELAEAADTLSGMMTRLMSAETPSQYAKSRFYNDLRDGAYVQRPDEALPFGESRGLVEERMGLTGTLAAENTDNDGNPIDAYSYLMKWLNVDQVILTKCYFRNGELELIKPDADGAGVTFDEMRERLVACYGEPYGVNIGPNGTELDWVDPAGGAFFALIPSSHDYELEIRRYEEKREMLVRREVAADADGYLQQTVLDGGAADPDARASRLLALAQKFLPLKDSAYVAAVETYSGGTGAEMELGRGGDDGSSFVWKLDAVRELGRDGGWRDETDTVRRLAHLYGEMLAEAEPERYLAAFEERFGPADAEDADEKAAEQGTADEEDADAAETEAAEQGTADEESAAEGTADGEDAETTADADGEDAPDFAECFQWFLLTDVPSDAMGELAGPIGFFYDFPELAEYRSLVRENLNLNVTEP